MKNKLLFVFALSCSGAQASSMIAAGYKMETVRNVAGAIQAAGEWYSVGGPQINDNGQIAYNPTNVSVAFADKVIGGWNVALGKGQLYDFNNQGKAVGYSYDSQLHRHATIFAGGADGVNGSFIDSSSKPSEARAINDLGQIVGLAGATSPYSFLGVGISGQVSSHSQVVEAINNKGEYIDVINGTANIYPNSLSAQKATSDHLFNDLNDNGFASAYNGANRVGANEVVYDFNNGEWKSAGVAGQNTYAMAINNQNDVVGMSSFSGSGNHAFITKKLDINQTVDLNAVFHGADDGYGYWDRLEYATDINSKGQIIGFGIYKQKFVANGVTNYLSMNRAIFVLTPVPEPETYAMLLAGLGVVGWSLRKRKQLVH